MFSFTGAMGDDFPVGGGSGGGAGSANVSGLTSRIRDLEDQMGRLQLLNQALWEVLSEKAGISEEEFLARVKDIDLRDGQEDGKMSHKALKCPRCQRVSSSKHWRCLYCNTKFKRPIMG